MISFLTFKYLNLNVFVQGNLIHEENIELYKKVNLIYQYNMKLPRYLNNLHKLQLSQKRPNKKSTIQLKIYCKEIYSHPKWKNFNTRSMEQGTWMDQIEISSQTVRASERTHMDLFISSLASHNKTMRHQPELQNWGTIPSLTYYANHD